MTGGPQALADHNSVVRQGPSKASVGHPSTRRDVSYCKERPGHGIVTRPGRFKDFQVPPSLIDSKAFVGLQTDKWMRNLEAILLKGFAETSSKRDSLRDSLLVKWSREMFPNQQPAGRFDVHELDCWMRDSLKKILQARDERRDADQLDTPPPVEEASIELLTAEHSVGVAEKFSALQRSMEGDMDFIKAVMDTYTPVVREIVRQVSCQCMERGELLTRVWGGNLALFDHLRTAQEEMVQKVQDMNTFFQTATERDKANTQANNRASRVIDELEYQITQLETKNRVLQEELQRKEDVFLEMTSEKTKLSAEDFQAMQEALRQEQQKRALLEDEAGQTRQDVERLKAELGNAEEKIADLHEEVVMKDEDAKLLTPRPDFQDPVALSSECETTKEAVLALEDELSRLRKGLASMRRLTTGARRASEIAKEDSSENAATPTVNTDEESLAPAKRTVQVASPTKDSSATFDWSIAINAVKDDNIGEPQHVFTVLGEGPLIPKFLRGKSSIKVKNKFVSKRDVEKVIKEVWKEKSRYDDDRVKNAKPFTELPTYLYTFLQKKYGVEAFVLEAGYNLLRSVHKYSYDADCEMFLKILTGEVHEDVLKDQMKLLTDLQLLFERTDSKKNGSMTGKLQLANVKSLIREFFYIRNDDDIDAMFKALAESQKDLFKEDWKSKIVNYKSLFEEDHNYDQGPFAECVRDQHLESRAKYLVEVKQAILSHSPEGEVSFRLAQDTIRSVDPSISDDILGQYVARGFNMSLKELKELEEEEVPVVANVDIFVSNLGSGVIYGRQAGRKAEGAGLNRSKAKMSSKIPKKK
ncbi:hypothetical protein CYMTET_18149 [Cymbomonas tetramitiformis]|uniref:Translin-associated factor X-interacting protein 1 N-terminal domain-containing protein n=1 Tax=Cymbomonas tetramitiformis TaxID=36881 RepID=A0AAE0L675_9CHLO|nr:hypothetical protein CYMTET_18149 [Cymbomonas tetramitiformis]